MIQYPSPEQENEIKEQLQEMGVDVYEPQSRSEQTVASLLEDFSHFVLFEEKQTCLQILQQDMSDSVGELQGGNDDFSIYRVSLPSDIDDDGEEEERIFERQDNRAKYKNAALELLQRFHHHKSIKSQNKLTIKKIKHYMLGMCDRRSRERHEARNYTSLGNLMFILQFGGPTMGQVRHIDNMVPNVQICLYMSTNCPSTIVYAMKGEDDDDGHGFPVTNGRTLLQFWERNSSIHTGMKVDVVPRLVKDILENRSNVNLKSKWYTKYFAFWKTIDSLLYCFGKLYQPVSYQLGLQTDPGTTLIAGGNEVHAGPPTKGPRMFAFAIGIPEELDDFHGDQGEESVTDDAGDNDGELQYSPVLLHIDFCCLLFSVLDYEYSNSDKETCVVEAKHFLLDVLMVLIKDYPMKGYLRQIANERSELINWLERVLDSLDDEDAINTLLHYAVTSDDIFFTPDVIKRRSKKKKRRKCRS